MRWLVKITMGVCIMTWKEAKQEIKTHVNKGTNVNTVPGINKNGKVSKHRIVKRVWDGGYEIPKEEDKKRSPMKVTWDMLEKCWNAMVDNGGEYDIKALKKEDPAYPDYSRKAGCYVQTIHMIFEKAGLT